MHSKLQHKNVVSLKGVTTDPTNDETMIIMEYMENGSLQDLIVDNQVQFSRSDAIQIALDVAEGLQYLHSQKIIHRDLKSGNVLVGLDQFILILHCLTNIIQSSMTIKSGQSCQTLAL